MNPETIDPVAAGIAAGALWSVVIARVARKLAKSSREVDRG